MRRGRGIRVRFGCVGHRGYGDCNRRRVSVTGGIGDRIGNHIRPVKVRVRRIADRAVGVDHNAAVWRGCGGNRQRIAVRIAVIAQNRNGDRGIFRGCCQIIHCVGRVIRHQHVFDIGKAHRPCRCPRRIAERHHAVFGIGRIIGHRQRPKAAQIKRVKIIAGFRPVNHIARVAAGDHITVSTTDQRIIALTANQRVIAGIAVDQIVVQAAVQRIRARTAVQRVIIIAAKDNVIAQTA